MSDDFRQLQASMIQSLLIPNGIYNPRVLATMRLVPRHHFMRSAKRHLSYHDRALPIGNGQHSLSPLVIAQALQALSLKGDEEVLEVGTGSGYLTALLHDLSAYVYSLEISPYHAARAAEKLETFGYQNLDVHIGDGSQGLPDMAPFDAIVVTAAVEQIPRRLAIQLRDGGRLVIPIIEGKQQHLRLLQRDGERWLSRTIATIHTELLQGRYGAQSDDPHVSA